MNVAIGGNLRYPFLPKSPVESTNSGHFCIRITRNLRREPLVSVIENETATAKEAPSLSGSRSMSRRLILLRHAKSSWQYPSLRGSISPLSAKFPTGDKIISKIISSSNILTKIKKDLAEGQNEIGEAHPN
ncbi:hypothetical protein SLEP1_g53741 [Rubroshorea leprosula]|uniref:Uncharacterized protein n=1 Tax=Rubroshorea leprosula TaxID=152421 RepID=A0AAV5MBD9_9ROSI|nr:hypothetical protein SLEP1_g53741 [Rubroshorea leprosula]